MLCPAPPLRFDGASDHTPPPCEQHARRWLALICCVVAAIAFGVLRAVRAMLCAEPGLLLNRGAAVQPANTAGVTPIFAAALAGHARLVQLLLDHGADVNTACHRGQTPLWAAAYGGHFELAEMLLDNGADVMAPNKTEGPGFGATLWMSLGAGGTGPALLEILRTVPQLPY